MNAHQRGWLLPPVSLALVAGVLIGRITCSMILPACAGILSFVSVIILRNRLRFFACVVFCFCLGVFSGTSAFHPALPPEGEYKVSGVISDEIAQGSYGQVRLILSDVRLNNQPYPSGAYWTFYTEQLSPDLLPGKEVSFTATLYHPRGSVNPDGYDFRESLLQKGITIGLYGGADNLLISDPRSFSFYGSMAAFRHHLSVSLIASLGHETGAYASALLLGMRTLVSSEDRQAFSKLGIAHILSVSGFHVGVIAGAMALLFHMLRISRRIRLLLYLLFLSVYAVLCGLNPPVIRASVLLLLSLEGRILNRPRSGIHLLCAVLFLMTLFSPVQVTSASFQLTFCAMAGLIWFSPIAQRISLFPGKTGQRISESLVLTFGIQLGLLFPELLFFQRLPLLVFLINLPAMLISSFLILMFWAVLLLLPFPALSSLISGPLSSFTGCLLSLIRQISSLPGLALWIHAPTVLSLFGIILLFAGFCTLVRLRTPFRAGSIIAGAAVLVLSLLPFSHNKTEYIQFSAGNADSAVLWDQDEVYVIDTGEDDGIISSFLRKRRLIPDAVILTHLHTDHAGGLRSLIDDEIPVRLILLPAGAELQQIHPDILSMLQELRNSGTEIRSLSRGDVLPLPSGYMSVLWPEKDKIRSGQDANQYSLVLRIMLKGTVLLQAGDLTGSYELYGAAPADILKASHHGSLSSTGSGFLKLVSPETVLLSCRQQSRLQEFRDRIGACRVFGTPESGAVTICFEESGYTVIPYLDQ